MMLGKIFMKIGPTVWIYMYRDETSVAVEMGVASARFGNHVNSLLWREHKKESDNYLLFTSNLFIKGIYDILYTELTL